VPAVFGVCLIGGLVLGAVDLGDRQTALIEVIFGLLLVFVLAATMRRRILAYGLCAPLSGLGFLAFLAAGFGR
jgi:hypothetical protein